MRACSPPTHLKKLFKCHVLPALSSLLRLSFSNVLTVLEKNTMPCREPTYFHHFRPVPHLCWCDNIDLDYGVDFYDQSCLRCYGIVFILNFDFFNLADCLCAPRPSHNEAHFCTVCFHLQFLPDGSVPLRADIAVRRAFAALTREFGYWNGRSA